MARASRLTERMTFTIPVSEKARLRIEAKARSLSLAAHVRNKIDDLIALHDLQVTMAEIERKDAVIQ